MKDPDSSSFAVRESSDKCAPVVPHCCHPIPVETGRESSKKSERPPKRHSNERNSGRPRNGFSRHRPARRAVLMRDGGRWGPDGSNVTPTEGPPSSQDRTVTRPSPSATASGAPSSSSQTPRRTNSETASLADSTSAGSEARQDQLAPDDLSCELCFAWMTGHIRKRKEGHPACPQCAAKYLHSPQCDLANHEQACPSRQTQQSAAGSQEPAASSGERQSPNEDGDSEGPGTTVPVREAGRCKDEPEEPDSFWVQAAVEQLCEAGWPEESFMEAVRIEFSSGTMSMSVSEGLDLS
uniref:Uncharacterized protein n=1 Tax=Chromera velia CCMP2878 TaxID=1169474 RepID=A0A0G4HSF1_9ALVE|eukprot:Cvel_30987.t1-p1 / transcript=Cvel_30987.t1 / gene=Cvel_30987 / organism=Chromera_velia_CCMP2878 / gene_product=hypothetical protein / transcript_product=hypothetical protein / location=Cvel_scaffold4527:637-1865(+) / protein_length=294 / sequence_SO=supercontig / SO=protein_coding / is_pseudo=false